MIFLTTERVIWLHSQTISTHSGSEGIRDLPGLESAVAAAQNRYQYENSDFAELAATYAFHLSNAHAFIDGNKRIGAIAAETFLLVNGYALKAGEEEWESICMRIASGEIDRNEVESFFKETVAKLKT